jgi:hypothetical protein
VRRVTLPEGRVWLRVADPEWRDPLEPRFAAERGGRWNPPSSFDALYLNGDVATARLQLERMLADSPLRIDDLEDDAYVLVAATLPRQQECADAVGADALLALGLATIYPLDAEGNLVGQTVCQGIGAIVHEARLRGVWCRSACTPDGRGRELAWFPATQRSRAQPVWPKPLPLAAWRDADGWKAIGLGEQSEPR